MSLQLRMQMAVKQYAYYFKGSKLALVEKKRLEEELKMTKELEEQDKEAAKENLKNFKNVR